MPLIKEPKYLRVLTPVTKGGNINKLDSDGRRLYKESHARVKAMEAFITENRRRPEHLKYILEIVDNPDYVPRRAATEKVRGVKMRPAAEPSQIIEQPAAHNPNQIVMSKSELEALVERIKSDVKKSFEADQERDKKDYRNERDRLLKERKKYEELNGKQNKKVNNEAE